MANIPIVKTYQQLVASMIKTLSTKAGTNDTATGSAMRSTIETAAMSDFLIQGSIIAAINSTDLDRAEGSDLDLIGIEEGVQRPQSIASVGTITIGNTNFSKISTKVYSGSAAPAVNSLTINVSDAALFPTAGSIYIGRGTANYEGPLQYSSITPVGNYYTINLIAPTAKNHNLNESVVLAQGGNRVISAGMIVQTPSNTTNASILFRVTNTVTIPDGESKFTDIQVTCTELGTKGNVPAQAIKEFSSVPFVGAYVTNETPLTSGQDVMSDKDYRLLIKKYRQNKAKGTDLAIKTAAIGVSSSDDKKTVVSAEIRKPANREEPATLFIDDGLIYEPIFSGQGFEYVIDNANGGEKYLQLQNEDITKAISVSTLTAPFNITGGLTLAVEVGGIYSAHTFVASDFATQNAATVAELVNSINSNNSLLFNARSVNNSTLLSLFAKNYKNEDVKVVVPKGINEVDANAYFGFTEKQTYTIRLYKNDNLLIKDGSQAAVFSKPKSSWGTVSSGDTLEVQVDRQYVATTYTFTDALFQSLGYMSMSSTLPIEAWAEAFNVTIPGLTTTIEGNLLKFQSNLGANSTAKVSISGGTLLVPLFVGAQTSTGRSADYYLNRSTGNIELVTPLVAGDTITAGSKNTRGFVQSSLMATGSVTLGTSPAIWLSVDDTLTKSISHSAVATTTITVTNVGDIWTFTSSVSTAFANIQAGDWLISADPALKALNPNFESHWRISSVNAPDSISFKMNSSLGTTGVASLSGTGKLAFYRTDSEIQKISLPSGIQTIPTLVGLINSSLVGGLAESYLGKYIRILTKTYNTNGSVLFAMANADAEPLGFTISSMDVSTDSHVAFAESTALASGMPIFVHNTNTASDATAPYQVSITTDPAVYKISKNDLMNYLNPVSEVSSNKGLVYPVQQYNNLGLVNLKDNSLSKDVLANDRVFWSQPFNFTNQDNLVVIFDKDGANKSVNVKMSRQATINNTVAPTSLTFRAYDSDFSPTANFPNQFGTGFDFSNYKVHLKAKALYTPSGTDNNMYVRASEYGPNGNQIRFKVEYPAAASSALSHVVSVGKNTNVIVYLASDVERLGGSWDSTTQFSVSLVAANTWRYSLVAGTSPDFATIGTVAGDLITVAYTSKFLPQNTGTFKVVAATNTYVDVYNPNGVTEAAVKLQVPSELSVYPLDASNNKASDLQTYVTNNLSAYIALTQEESGSGVISASSDDDLIGWLQLTDGEHFVLSSNVGTIITPLNEFTIKDSLSNTASSYVGESFYLIPTTASQTVDFVNTFAVSPLSSIGSLGLSDENQKIQLSSSLFGSNGTVQVSGGSANATESGLSSNGEMAFVFALEAQPYGAIRNGSTVTLSSAGDMGLSVGDQIIVSGIKNTAFNGTFYVTSANKNTVSYSTLAAQTISSVIRTSNVSSITTTVLDHKIAVGDLVTISGVSDPSFDGEFVVTSVPLTNTFTYAQVGANASSSGGTIPTVKSGNGSVVTSHVKVSIASSGRSGMQVGQWAKLESSMVQKKAIGLTASSTMALNTSPGPDTIVTISGPGSFLTNRTHSAGLTSLFKVERQGQFTAYVCVGGTSPDFTFNGIKENDWVTFGSTFSVENRGTFRVIKVFGADTLYVENVYAKEEEVTLSSGADVSLVSYDSVRVGDTLVIGSTVLDNGTPSNAGSYTVTSVTSATSMTIEPVNNSKTAMTLGLEEYTKIYVLEGTPVKAYRRIVNIATHPSNSNLVNAVLEADAAAPLADKMNIESGTVISIQSKLGFTNYIQSGTDSYKYYGGLIHEVGKVIRGQADDPLTYSGYAAAGSYIEISSPLPRQIALAIVIKNTTGISFSVIKTRLQSAVSSYINSLGIGEDIVFSEIISIIQQINGVQAVAISSPTYDATNLLIPVNVDEKAKVANLNDIIISLSV